MNEDKRLVIVAVSSGFGEQSKNARCFVLNVRKEKYSTLIKYIWRGGGSVTNWDVPNCLKIMWVISKSPCLPVCRPFPVLVVCHIPFPLAIYHLTSERMLSFISWEKICCVDVFPRSLLFRDVHSSTFPNAHQDLAPKREYCTKRRGKYFFFFKSVWSALSYETISAELILWICFKTPEGGFGMVDTAQPCASESRQLSRSVTGVQSSLVLLSLQEIRGKPFIYTQGILAKME